MSNHLQTDNRSKIEERLDAAAGRRCSRPDSRHPRRSARPACAQRGVAHRAHFLTLTVEPHQARLLVAAAWLHDIGYAPRLRDTGFHPLDGARHLRAIGWPPAICNLVAHHSRARFVARVRNLDRELAAYPFSEDAVSDALTVADQTTGVHGESMVPEERMRDMLERHGPDSANALAHPGREPYLRAATDRVARRLDSVGLHTALGAVAA